ncbi:MAG TPA: hypothetical protein VM575_14645 [Nocardioides sp.]|nr:hypothetical protein [Nocardioides sp.]
MSDEKWLREGLAGAVPEPPAAPDRAEGARTRARRARRTTAAVIGGAAASVLLVAGVVAVLGDDGPERGDVANDGPVSPYDAPACPGSPADAQTQVGPDHVPDGATSVRLCGGNEFAIDLPADALVTDVDALAAAVNDLDPKAPDAMCTMDLGPRYQLVFSYPDESTTVVSGDLYGCHDVVVNGVERTGADEPWERFIDLLRAQREQLDPPAPVDAPTIDCATSGTPSVGRAQDLAAAVLCVESPEGSGQPQRAVFSNAEVAVLRADIADRAHYTTGMPRCAAPTAFIRIVVVTTWGDRLDLQPSCHLSHFQTSPASGLAWNPTDETQAILERLIGEAR